MIAAYVMRGRVQAIQMAMLFFVLAVLLPPLSIIGSAVVGLVALRLGTRSALEVALGATVAAMLAGWLLLDGPGIGLASAMFWLPVLLLALLLRYSSSLALTLQAGLVVGLLPMLVESVYFTSAQDGWLELLEPLRQTLSQAEMLGPEQAAEVMDWLSRWLTAIIGGGLFLQICLGLFLARGWQAKLYNPGGFAAEFRTLRLSRSLTYLATAVLMLLLLADGAQWVLLRVAVVLLSLLFFLQGLAVLHALLARSAAGHAWLVGAYVLLFLAMPYMGMALVATGYMDAWWDFRRFAKKPSKPDGGGAEDE